jgi:hypothetical protein
MRLRVDLLEIEGPVSSQMSITAMASPNEASVALTH